MLAKLRFGRWRGTIWVGRGSVEDTNTGVERSSRPIMDSILAEKVPGHSARIDLSSEALSQHGAARIYWRHDFTRFLAGWRINPLEIRRAVAV